VHAEPRGWSHSIEQDADGSYRLQIVDEDGEPWPVARQVTRGQAEKLVVRIAEEARRERKPIKLVIRDPHFMAATVITVKRQAI
jgi:hypothetical protein